MIHAPAGRAPGGAEAAARGGVLWGASGRLDAVLGPVALLVLWQILGGMLPWARYTISSPAAIALRAWHDLAIYPTNVAATLWEAARGFFWGNLAAIALALLIMQVRRLEGLLMQIAIVIYATPLLAIAPIIAVVLPGDEPKVALAALAVFFPTVITTLIGLRSADGASLDLIHTLGGRPFDALRKVRLPASVPWLLAGFRVAAPGAVLGAILGEFLGGDRGLGVAMVNAMATLDTPRVWGLAIVASALAGGGFALAAAAARVLVTWAPPLDAAPALTGRASRGLLPEGGDGGAAGAGRWALRRAGLTVVSIGVIVGLWVAFIRVFHLNPFFAKTPVQVLRDLVAGTAAVENRRELSAALAMTLEDAAAGFGVGTVTAAFVAVLFVVYPRLERAFMPVAITLRSVPVIAMTPLLVLLFGRGIAGTTAITAIITFFPTLVNVMQGLRSASPQAIEVLRLYAASPWAVVWKIRIPSALPSVFAAARISVLASILGAIVAEWLATGRGLGYLMIIARAQFQFTMLWAAGILVTIVSVLLYGMLTWVEAPVLRRYAPSQAGR
ncbi:MAG TPA: ABC transporter permease subunit [bacterium]|nr:ABC transporter permease subunit [bacterium]